MNATVRSVASSHCPFNAVFHLPPFVSIRYTDPAICSTLAGSACMYSFSVGPFDQEVEARLQDKAIQ